MTIDRQAIGKAGEDAVGRYLLENGLKILERNYRAGKGEIDLIARDGDTIVFVEVKTRSGTSYGTAAEAVGYKKQQMVIQTARRFIAQRKLYDTAARFDVAEVYADGGDYSVNYISDAFTL